MSQAAKDILINKAISLFNEGSVEKSLKEETKRKIKSVNDEIEVTSYQVAIEQEGDVSVGSQNGHNALQNVDAEKQNKRVEKRRKNGIKRKK